jgi:hypothetical protein
VCLLEQAICRLRCADEYPESISAGRITPKMALSAISESQRRDRRRLREMAKTLETPLMLWSLSIALSATTLLRSLLIEPRGRSQKSMAIGGILKQRAKILTRLSTMLARLLVTSGRNRINLSRQQGKLSMEHPRTMRCRINNQGQSA